MQHYLGNPTNRHIEDISKEIEAAIKKAVARVRRREVKPMLDAAELAVTYIEDGAPATAIDRLNFAVAAVKEEQKGKVKHVHNRTR